MSRIISAKNDVIFKKLFADSSNRELLKSFLSAALNIPQEDITDIVVKNPELAPNISDGKLSRLDILLSTHNRNINIEMQNAKTTDYKERVLYYWSRMYNDPLKIGQKYSELRESISINILNHIMFDCKEYMSSFSIRENTRYELYCDKLGLYFFELPKISAVPDTSDMRKLWLQVINADSEEELNMLNETNIPIIQQGVKSIFTLNSDDNVRSMAWEREKAERDYYSEIANAAEEGEARGIAIGEARGITIGEARGREAERARIIRKFLQSGMTEEQINSILS